MKVLGVIIAGGKSSRMGRDKALIEWRGMTLLEQVEIRLKPQVDKLAINTNTEGLRAEIIIPDMRKTGTPLAGIHAALVYAQEHGFDAVLSAPCDCPLLPKDLRTRLDGKGPAIARSGDQAHYLTGLWPVETLPLIEDLRRVQDFAHATQAREVEWAIIPYDPFFNVNTPEDLANLPTDD